MGLDMHSSKLVVQFEGLDEKIRGRELTTTLFHSKDVHQDANHDERDQGPDVNA
jgi:hypothetical protein